jgi:alkanesulfonate monooxygenase SsuD/methylene tetrahydromethanopterin reductase-like flavin-dependent oxidoreductase (luciferase family)
LDSNPALLAKMASHLDVVSGGAGERLRRLEEALQIIQALGTRPPSTPATSAPRAR